MASAGAERQGFDANDGGQVEATVKMRKQSPAARRLPFQGAAKPAGIHTDQQQVALTCKMSCGGLGDLGRSREMNEIVTAIDFGAMEYASTFGFSP